MVRWLYPEDRFVYSFFENTPLYPVPAGSTLTIYLDQPATTLANIQYYPSALSVPGSVLVIGDDTLIPQFYGPDGVLELWGKPEGTTDTYPIEANFGPRIADLQDSAGLTVSFADGRYAKLSDFNALSTVVSGINAGRSYVHTQDIPATEWIVHHNLGYYPNVALVDTSGEVIESEVSYVDENTVRVEHYYAVGGNAYCS